MQFSYRAMAMQRSASLISLWLCSIVILVSGNGYSTGPIASLNKTFLAGNSISDDNGLPYFQDSKGVSRFMLEQAKGQGIRRSDQNFVNSEVGPDLEDKATKISPKIEQKYSERAFNALQSDWRNQAESIKGDVDDILLDIDGAKDKASAISSCAMHLRNCQKQLKQAQKALQRNDPDFVTAKVRLRWARDEVARCLGSVKVKNTSKKYYGQAELENADEKIKNALQVVLGLSKVSRVKSLLKGIPLNEEDVIMGGSRVRADGNNFIVPFNSTTYRGSRVRSLARFQSGIFSAQIRCPRGRNLNGLTTAFYLATNGSDPARSAIIMEFYGGSQSVVALSTIRKGVMGQTSLVALGYDCSLAKHTYSIAWSSTRIMWRNEKGMLGIINTKWWKEPLPWRPMHLYLQVLNVNTVGKFQWPTRIKQKGVFRATFERVTVISPVDNYYLPPLPTVPPHSPLFPISVDYCMDHMKIGKNQVRIKFDTKKCGGRFRSTVNYLYGQFAAQIRCPSGDTGGLVSAFYLSTMEGSPTRDEIDIEFLGGYKNKMLTNVFVNGVGYREKVIDLGFDCSKAFHTYTIRYTKDSIVWFVDRKPVRQYLKKKERKFPDTPMFLYGSVWNASDFLLGRFAGKWKGYGMPFYTTYRNMEINSPWLGKE